VTPRNSTAGARTPASAQNMVSTDPDLTTTEVAPRVAAAVRTLEAGQAGIVDQDEAASGSIRILRSAQHWLEVASLERRWAS
jgi:hypothetical protein